MPFPFVSWFMPATGFCTSLLLINQQSQPMSCFRFCTLFIRYLVVPLGGQVVCLTIPCMVEIRALHRCDKITLSSDIGLFGDSAPGLGTHGMSYLGYNCSLWCMKPHSSFICCTGYFCTLQIGMHYLK